jgi:hypothetical protein
MTAQRVPERVLVAVNLLNKEYLIIGFQGLAVQ